MRSSMKRLPALIALGLTACLFLSGCYTVPETGRKSLNLLSPSEELALGASAFSEIKTKEKISTDEAKGAALQRVGRRLAGAVGDDIKDPEWEFVLFENDDINAFALPGGKVGVYTGLFKIVHSEDDLAVVVGHEIAHVTARHGAERMSHGVLIDLGGALLDTVLANQEAEVRDGWKSAYGMGATLGVVLPFSRGNEAEADEIGLVYAARGGYDPRMAIGFWKRMKEATAGADKPPEWLSTHPSDDTRIKKIEEMMPRMLVIYEEAKKTPAP
jgi:metalloendopeptidase OMA1, mitochondrial